MTMSNGVNGGSPGSQTDAGSSQDNSQRQPQQQQQPDWAAFQRSIDAMGERFGEQLRTELGGRLDNLTRTVEDSRPQDQPADPTEGFDFDGATPRQLYDLMTQRFESMIEQTLQSTLEQVLAPYAQEMTSMRRDIVTDQGSREIDRLQAAHKDFVDWVPEMKEIAKKHTSLSITETFNLAKAANPQKAAELDKKYNPPPPPPPRPFSLGPSSATRTDGQSKPMNKQEAALDAYRQIQERHPGVLAALDNAFPGF